MTEKQPLSDLSIEERAARDAEEKDENGKYVEHVYAPEIKEYHEARARLDEHYKPPKRRRN